MVVTSSGAENRTVCTLVQWDPQSGLTRLGFCITPAQLPLTFESVYCSVFASCPAAFARRGRLLSCRLSSSEAELMRRSVLTSSSCCSRPLHVQTCTKAD